MKTLKSAVCLALACALCACSTQSLVRLDEKNTQYLHENAKFTIAKVEDKSGFKSTSSEITVNLTEKMKQALESAMQRDDLLGAKDLTISSVVTEYQPGDDLKRWYGPGSGYTRLVAVTSISKRKKVIGAIYVAREVGFAGSVTSGTWEKVFDDVALETCVKLKELVAPKIVEEPEAEEASENEKEEAVKEEAPKEAKKVVKKAQKKVATKKTAK